MANGNSPSNPPPKPSPGTPVGADVPGKGDSGGATPDRNHKPLQTITLN